MRCPKCHYLSFEPEPRCRNCGYDCELAHSELAIKPAIEAPVTFADLDLRETPRMAPVQPHVQASAQGAGHAAPAAPPAFATAPSLARTLTPPTPTPTLRPTPPPTPTPRAIPRPPMPTSELPLFVRGFPPAELSPAADLDRPLVQVPSSPRPPLAVRRRAPDAVAKSAPAAMAAKSQPVAHGRLLELTNQEPIWAPVSTQTAVAAPEPDNVSTRYDRVPLSERAVAALVDILVLGAVDLAIVWFTLKICALTVGQALRLPVLPLAAFFILLDVVYFLTFTAAQGQTFGKMVAGIRVVSIQPDRSVSSEVTMRQAFLRALLIVPSTALAGLGFLPTLVGNGPAVHDRLSHTRVVRS